MSRKSAAAAGLYHESRWKVENAARYKSGTAIAAHDALSMQTYAPATKRRERTNAGGPTMADWHPWQTLDTLRREIDRVFNETGSRSEPFFRTAFLPAQAARRYPLINLYEDKDTVYVEALAPGVDPDTLHLSVVGHTLSIAGEKRRVAGDVKPEAFHRSERATGKFVRHIELPVEVVDVDEGKVQAEYTNGLLTVTLPKAEKAKPKQIAVQVG
jgi:HSP20 family protein